MKKTVIISFLCQLIGIILMGSTGFLAALDIDLSNVQPLYSIVSISLGAMLLIIGLIINIKLRKGKRLN